VRIRYGAGRFDMGATTSPVLYSMTLRYDEESSRPVHQYDPEEHSLTLGIESESRRLHTNLRDQAKGELRVLLSRAVPLDLELELGATRSTLDLGGLSLVNARLQSGASETRLDFSSPNAADLRRFDIEVGAASFEARNLANANAATIRLHGGVGTVDLDFGGRWTRDMTVEVEVALGKLTLHVPRDVGVRMDVQKVLASFDHEGLRKRGDAYFSENWDTAKYHVRIRAETVFGAIELDRGT
jgi:hypothetical protein